MAELQVRFRATLNLFIDIGESTFEDGVKNGRKKLDNTLENIKKQFPEVNFIFSTEVREVRVKPEGD